MKGKMNKLAVVLGIATMLMALPSALADSGSAVTAATVSNVQPTVGIATITTGANIDPNIGQANRTINAEATATDNNGGGDVADARCNVYDTGDNLFATVAGVVEAGTISDETVTVTCEFDLRYYDDNGDWDVKFQVQDESAIWSAEGAEGTFTYTEVTYIDLNETSVGWDALTPGASGVQSEDWINVTNFGNGEIQLQVKGDHLLGGGQDIEIDNVTIDDIDESGAQAYGLTYADFKGAGDDILVYGEGQDWIDLTHYIDVPSPLLDGVYTGAIYICAGAGC